MKQPNYNIYLGNISNLLRGKQIPYLISRLNIHGTDINASFGKYDVFDPEKKRVVFMNCGLFQL